MEENTAPFGQREGHGADSGVDVRGSDSKHCSATVDADVTCAGNVCSVLLLAQTGHSGFVENGAINSGSGTCWDVIGSNGVA